ncbi:MAG TPA: SDR family NAD(P)-dependent oxidoreductase [Candidatus Acidoferrum sp.]|nr:SDR family NAD(P)-dependent oxidoreductase [Candidatus Acidoferrum sp.]
MTGSTQTALVTGTSRGIGQHIARALAAAGYNLVLASRSQAEVEALASELNANGSTALAVPTDLTDPTSIERLVSVAEHAFGRVDVLVNNAGGDPQREFDQMSWMENEKIFRLNVLAPMQLTHLLLPGMLARGSGHIVNISSIAGRVAFPYTEAYAAAKDGLIGFTRVLRNDYRSRGVSASVIVLGAIRDSGQGQRTSDELGFKMPRFSTAPAGAVGQAVVKAIREDRVEIVLMPGPGRLMKALMDLFPGFGPKMNQMAGADATMRRVIELRKRTLLNV